MDVRPVSPDATITWRSDFETAHALRVRLSGAASAELPPCLAAEDAGRQRRMDAWRPPSATEPNNEDPDNVAPDETVEEETEQLPILSRPYLIRMRFHQLHRIRLVCSRLLVAIVETG